MSRIPDAKLEELQDEIEGTCLSLSEIIERHDLDVLEEDLQDRLLDGVSPVELCGGCEWWFRSADLEFDEARNSGICSQCEEDAE